MTEYAWFLILPATMCLIIFVMMVTRRASIVMAVVSYFLFSYIQIGFMGVDQTTAATNAITWSLPVWLYFYFAQRVGEDWPVQLVKGLWTTYKRKGEQ